MFFNCILKLFVIALNSVLCIHGMEEQSSQIKNTLTFVNQTENLANPFTENDLFFKLKNQNNEDKPTCIVYAPNETITLLEELDKNSPKKPYKTTQYILSYKQPFTLNNSTKHATQAQKIDETYIFYVANEENKIYKVKCTESELAAYKLTSSELYKHASPIAHMSLLSEGNKNYLVTGSTYPSIKIYDLEESKLTLNTIHNSFLLGCIDNTLIYAKKQTPPTTAFGRWIESWFKKDTSFNCAIDFQENPTQNNNPITQPNPTVISIKPNNYPIILEDNLHVHILNQTEHKLIIVTKNNTLTTQTVDIANINIIINTHQIEIKPEGDEITIGHLDYNKFQYVSQILSTTGFGLYLKLYILDSSTKKAFTEQHKAANDQNHTTFVKYIIKNILKNIIKIKENKWDTFCETYLQLIKKQNASFMKLKYNPNDFNYLLTLSDNLFNPFRENDLSMFLDLTAKNNTVGLQKVNFKKNKRICNANYNYKFDKITKLYAHKNLLVIQENNKLFYTDITDNTHNFYYIPTNLNKDEKILHVLIYEDTICVLTNKHSITYHVTYNT